MTDKELIQLKAKVEEAKQQVATYKGQLQYLNQQLKDDYGCDTVGKAQKKLQTMEKEISVMDSQIETAKQELEEKYGEFL